MRGGTREGTAERRANLVSEGGRVRVVDTALAGSKARALVTEERHAAAREQRRVDHQRAEELRALRRRDAGLKRESVAHQKEDHHSMLALQASFEEARRAAVRREFEAAAREKAAAAARAQEEEHARSSDFVRRFEASRTDAALALVGSPRASAAASPRHRSQAAASSLLGIGDPNSPPAIALRARERGIVALSPRERYVPVPSQYQL
jgi:hypothetical protein